MTDTTEAVAAIRQRVEAAKARAEAAHDRVEEYMRRYRESERKGRTDKARAAEDRALWSDVAYQQGYAAALADLTAEAHETALSRSDVPPLADDVLALVEVIDRMADYLAAHGTWTHNYHAGCEIAGGTLRAALASRAAQGGDDGR